MYLLKNRDFDLEMKLPLENCSLVAFYTCNPHTHHIKRPLVAQVAAGNREVTKSSSFYFSLSCLLLIDVNPLGSDKRYLS